MGTLFSKMTVESTLVISLAAILRGQYYVVANITHTPEQSGGWTSDHPPLCCFTWHSPRAWGRIPA
jgi:hypothetical protein